LGFWRRKRRRDLEERRRKVRFFRRGGGRSRGRRKEASAVILPLDDLRGQLERPGVLLVAFALRQRGHFGLEHGVEVFGRRRERRRRGRRRGPRRRKHCLMEEIFGSECSLRELLAF
jgi:hypothetical protein